MLLYPTHVVTCRTVLITNQFSIFIRKSISINSVLAVIPCSRLGGKSSAHRANQPGCESFESDENLSMTGNDRLASSASDGLQDLPGRFIRRHDEPCGRWVVTFGPGVSVIVHTVDVAGDETGADQRYFNAERP